MAEFYTLPHEGLINSKPITLGTNISDLLVTCRVGANTNIGLINRTKGYINSSTRDTYVKYFTGKVPYNEKSHKRWFEYLAEKLDIPKSGMDEWLNTTVAAGINPGFIKYEKNSKNQIQPIIASLMDIYYEVCGKNAIFPSHIAMGHCLVEGMGDTVTHDGSGYSGVGMTKIAKALKGTITGLGQVTRDTAGSAYDSALAASTSYGGGFVKYVNDIYGGDANFKKKVLSTDDGYISASRKDFKLQAFFQIFSLCNKLKSVQDHINRNNSKEKPTPQKKVYAAIKPYIMERDGKNCPFLESSDQLGVATYPFTPNTSVQYEVNKSLSLDMVNVLRAKHPTFAGASNVIKYNNEEIKLSILNMVGDYLNLGDTIPKTSKDTLIMALAEYNGEQIRYSRTAQGDVMFSCDAGILKVGLNYAKIINSDSLQLLNITMVETIDGQTTFRSTDTSFNNDGTPVYKMVGPSADQAHRNYLRATSLFSSATIKDYPKGFEPRSFLFGTRLDYLDTTVGQFGRVFTDGRIETITSSVTVSATEYIDKKNKKKIKYTTTIGKHHTAVSTGKQEVLENIGTGTTSINTKFSQSAVQQEQYNAANSILRSISNYDELTLGQDYTARFNALWTAFASFSFNDGYKYPINVAGVIGTPPRYAENADMVSTTYSNFFNPSTKVEGSLKNIYGRAWAEHAVTYGNFVAMTPCVPKFMGRLNGVKVAAYMQKLQMDSANGGDTSFAEDKLKQAQGDNPTPYASTLFQALPATSEYSNDVVGLIKGAAAVFGITEPEYAALMDENEATNVELGGNGSFDYYGHVKFDNNIITQIYLNGVSSNGDKKQGQIKNLLESMYCVMMYNSGPIESSESVTNTVGPSFMENLINRPMAEVARDTAFFLNTKDVGKDVNDIDEALGKIADDKNKDMTEMLKDSASNMLGLLKSGSSKLSAQIKMPKVFKGSDYGKQHSVNLKLVSPSPDYKSVFKYIAVELARIFPLVLPRQWGLFQDSVVSPYLVQVFCRGTMSIEMGMITSITINKNSSTIGLNGLPTEVDVELGITDLFPFLSIPNKPSDSFTLGNYHVAGYLTYMSTLAGLPLYRGDTENILQNKAAVISSNLTKMSITPQRKATENINDMMVGVWDYFTR